MFLKVLDVRNGPHMENFAPYSIYADIVSCHFRHYSAREQGTSDSPWGEAHVWMREPIKTAEVLGYCEVEKYIVLDGDAFLMNEQGRTISKFTRPQRIDADHRPASDYSRP